jgi:hypothetical protein
VNRIQIGIAIVVASLLVAAATPRSAGMATPELFDSGVPRGSSEILAGYYTDAAKRIKQVVENPSGRTAGSKEFKRARAATLIDQVDQVLGQLGHATSGWIGKNVPAAAVAGRKLANKQAVEAGVRPKGQAAIEGSFHLIDHRAPRSRSSARRRSTRSSPAVVIEGKPRETIKKLRDALKQVHGETVKVIDKNGDDDELRRRLLRRAGRAHEDARGDGRTRGTSGCRKLGWTWSRSSADLEELLHRVPRPGLFSCRATPDKYPAYSSLPGGGPPFHPNCSKSTRPVRRGARVRQAARPGRGSTTPTKLLGMDRARRSARSRTCSCSSR